MQSFKYYSIFILPFLFHHINKFKHCFRRVAIIELRLCFLFSFLHGMKLAALGENIEKYRNMKIELIRKLKLR